MKTKRHYLSYIEENIICHSRAMALSDFDGEKHAYTYGEMAREMAYLKATFKSLGLEKGDKIAICGRNCAHWAIAFLAVEAFEGVVVSILPDFTTEGVESLVRHSEAKVLFLGAGICRDFNKANTPELKRIFSLSTLRPLEGEEKLDEEKINAIFVEENGEEFVAENYKLPTENFDNLALINYTSGTTSQPKGVMLTSLNISSNIQFAMENIPIGVGKRIVSMLPMAHMFGMAFEFLFQLAGGCHIYFLTKMPTPQLLLSAFKEVKPHMILTVPLVIEKIFRKSIFPVLQKPVMKVLWATPGIGKVLRGKIHQKLMASFGGEINHLIIGGAALNGEVENCLRQIKFPYTVGYGITECAPLISYCDWHNFKEKSCGKIVDRMVAKIDSENPAEVVGEIMVKGENVMIGYYKNEEATRAVLDSEGWLRTGDLGLLDAGKNLFIKGRSKNMILGASGQNIYPEEIEDKLNALTGVVESVVISREGKIVALVFADSQVENLDAVMAENLKQLNANLPAYSRVAKIELVEKEFEKTPKKSIKRFLYK